MNRPARFTQRDWLFGAAVTAAKSGVTQLAMVGSTPTFAERGLRMPA
jgi:hypothetical protein